MARFLYDAPDGLRGRPAVSSTRPQRTTRSWTSNGVQYTVNTTSWDGPALSFNAMTGSANGPFRTFTAPSRTNRQHTHLGFGTGGLFGTAFGLLDDLARHTMQPQHTVIGGDFMGQGASARRVNVSSDSDDEDDHLAYGNGFDATAQRKKNNRRSIFGRLKDRLVDSSHPRRQDSSTSRSQSPAQPPTLPQRPGIPERRHSSYRTETREPDYVQRDAPEYIEVDYHDEPEPQPIPEPDPRRSRSRRQSVTEAEMIEALENAVEKERQNVRACKMALAQASRQSNVSSGYLQRIVDELKQHESTLANAIGCLNDAKAAQHRKSKPPPRSRSQPRERVRAQQRQSRQAPPAFRSFEEEFFAPFGGADPFIMGHRPDFIAQALDDMHAAHFGPRHNLDAFEQLFEQTRPAPDDAHFRFFSMPGGPQPNAQRKRQRYSTPNGGFGTQANGPPPAYTTTFQPPPPPPQPPATMLRPDEAKRLFITYNDRWTNLPPTSSDIPFPARGLHAGGLAARDSIWAPTVSEHVSNWSDETVMQANTQAFFLGVVGMIPRYTQNPGTGRIECGFENKTGGFSQQQVKELMDILKKEKVRWHSDRLGRRNDGRGGVNEKLQRDERARAVFHAVCELMENVAAVVT